MFSWHFTWTRDDKNYRKGEKKCLEEFPNAYVMMEALILVSIQFFFKYLRLDLNIWRDWLLSGVRSQAGATSKARYIDSTSGQLSYDRFISTLEAHSRFSSSTFSTFFLDSKLSATFRAPIRFLFDCFDSLRISHGRNEPFQYPRPGIELDL